MMTQLWAIWLLAWALLKTSLSWPLRRGRGPAYFRENYAAEGLLPVAPDVHTLLIRAGACTACGRCDRVTAEGGGVPLSQLVRGWTRSLPDAPLAAAEFARYSSEEMDRAEALCPMGVPIADLRVMVDRQAAQMTASH